MTARQHAIIMSADSVRAILAGRKTQTRRLVGRRVPYGVGARLWVKETWGVHHQADKEPGRIDDRLRLDDAKRQMPWASIEYRADAALSRFAPNRWRSPLFMPRWASRILLEVTSIREERLHDLSEQDALDEGVQCESWRSREAYASIWNAMHGKRAPWVSNPVVRVIGFRRVEGACAG